MSAETDFRFEVVKLLVQVALADDRVEVAEQAAVLKFARSWGLSDQAVRQIDEALHSSRSLGAPNLALLRTRRAEVILAAEQLCEADGEFSGDESRMVAEIEELLSGPPL